MIDRNYYSVDIPRKDLPGMEAHTQLITKKREKLQKLPDQQEASDDEFEANLNLIEMGSETQISESVRSIMTHDNTQANVEVTPTIASANVAIQPKKRGRKKKETLPTALEKSPDNQDTVVRRSQRFKNNRFFIKFF